MRKFILISMLIFGCLGRVDKVVAVSSLKAVSPTMNEVSPTEILLPTAVISKGNLTETVAKDSVYRLESVLEENRVGKWNILNTFRKAEEIAIDRGVAANTIVLLLLLPLVATLVSVLHYVLGLSGYGIFMPTMIAVVFLATGILGGLVLFGLILAISLLSSLTLRKLKLHFWPARSIGLMLITAGTLGLMIMSTYFKVLNIGNISIFPILFMILLAEEFVRTELAKSKKEAKRLMMGTLVLAMVGAGVMGMRGMQEIVLLHPGVSLIVGLVTNLIVGNYSGIRLSELRRFKKAIRQKSNKSLKPKV